MRICVCGLWHLGTVTAACVAEHFEVVGYDPEASTVSKLTGGEPSVFEQGLADLVKEGVQARKLSFTSDLEAAVSGADIVWVAFDTPVKDDDTADSEFVWRQVETVLPLLTDGKTLLVSSQVPVGFTKRAESAFGALYPGRKVSFAYSPENLRLGKALDAFRNPVRIVVGVRPNFDQARLTELFQPFCKNIEWMSVESAEMTKHALNAFLATCITFINELAVICEATGANAKDVERGLKSEPRIGPKAYLNPGAAFAGGTLARDVVFLTSIASDKNLPAHLLRAVMSSNQEHKNWPRRKLEQLLGDLSNKTIAVLGLTYKVGTDTLRRSSSVELCTWLAGRGARVQAFDPEVKDLPAELRRDIRLCETPGDALNGASAMVVATEWPAFLSLTPDDLANKMADTIVLDATSFLEQSLSSDVRIHYISVGKQWEVR